ncbi:hypothetical protein [Planococcus versutus]|uniref:hypothetical protein n=1 Tax=Planococcus versutus TaxID=1302659 RepID=UPI001EF71215|nr:hypothetical protein [Planococcus versutus]
MELIIYSDSAVFSAEVSPFLYQNEDVNSLFLGILKQIQTGHYKNYLLALVKEGEEIIAACLLTPPHALQLVVFQDVPGSEKEIARHLQNLGIQVSGIVGERKVCRLFAKAWIDKSGEKIDVLMDQGLYRIDAVNKM